jgi:hypothetical protein
MLIYAPHLFLSDLIHKMSSEALIFLFAIIITGVLLFTMVFFTIMFSDLECDYINPIDLCNKLNQFVLPEMMVHTLLTVIFLLSGNWIALGLNLPLTAWNIHKITQKRHMYDATDIFRTLSKHKTESFIY